MLKYLGDPITRLRLYLEKRNWIEQRYIENLREKLNTEIRDALKIAENEPYPHIDEMFNDVYCKITPNLQEQKLDLYKHLSKYSEHYSLDKFKK